MHEFLRAVPLFSQLPEEDLAHLGKMADELRLQAGEPLFHEGDAGDAAYVIESGELEIVKDSPSGEVLIAVVGKGEVIGEMALLDEAPRMAGARARTDVELLSIGQRQMDELLNTSSSAVRSMLSTVTKRWRETDALLLQNEKMAQLGTLTAGMAHELNNPASAVKRGAGQIKQAFARFQDIHFAINRKRPPKAQLAEMAKQDERARQVAEASLSIDALTRSDREYALETWLDEHGVENAWEYSSDLVNLGYDRESLEQLGEVIPSKLLQETIAWLSASYGIFSLLVEIRQGAKHIANVVTALKTYAYPEHGTLQPFDVNASLEGALDSMNERLGDITIHRQFASELPPIDSFPNELVQAWEHLLSNAIDAVEDGGEITLRTSLEDDVVLVEVEDTGTGIPEDIQPKIFDPFFTTKPPGEGVGLGLNIAYNIIHHRHHGDLSVHSQPGKTVAAVRLPCQPNKHGGGQISGFHNPKDATLKEILTKYKDIAVVGFSSRQDRAAFSVPAYLQEHGYNVYPVNPNLESALGTKAYPDLESLPHRPQVVQIFRRGEHALEVVEQAIAVGAEVVWMQEGVVNEEAAETARAAGLEVVMDTCMREQHRRLIDI